MIKTRAAGDEKPTRRRKAKAVRPAKVWDDLRPAKASRVIKKLSKWGTPQAQKDIDALRLETELRAEADIAERIRALFIRYDIPVIKKPEADPRPEPPAGFSYSYMPAPEPPWSPGPDDWILLALKLAVAHHEPEFRIAKPRSRVKAGDLFTQERIAARLVAGGRSLKEVCERTVEAVTRLKKRGQFKGNVPTPATLMTRYSGKKLPAPDELQLDPDFETRLGGLNIGSRLLAVADKITSTVRRHAGVRNLAPIGHTPPPIFPDDIVPEL